MSVITEKCPESFCYKEKAKCHTKWHPMRNISGRQVHSLILPCNFNTESFSFTREILELK